MKLTDPTEPDCIPVWQWWDQNGACPSSQCVWSCDASSWRVYCSLTCKLLSYMNMVLIDMQFATLILLAISPAACYDGRVLLCAGDELPTLQRLAVRLTAAVSSAGASERAWSAYGFIHSRKRNKLTKERAEDLVYVFTNLRLAKKFSEPHKFAEWVQEWAPLMRRSWYHMRRFRVSLRSRVYSIDLGISCKHFNDSV